MPEPILRTADPLHLVLGEGGAWDWYDPVRRCVVPRSPLVDAIFEHFREPRPASSFGGGDPAPGEQVARLARAGLLVEVVPCSPPEPRLGTPLPLARARPAMFHAPDWAGSLGADVVFLGVPSSAGTRAAGIARAPAALRSLARTFVYQVEPGTLAPVGFLDVRTRRRVLRGARIADAGDVVVPNDADGADALSAGLPALSRAIRAAGALAVVIGGDHSITPPFVRGLGPCQVVHVDAHLDLDPVPASGADHATALSALCAAPEVERVVQVGARGFDDVCWERALERVAEKLRFVERPARDLGAEVAGALAPDVPCWLSLDVDALECVGAQYLAPGGLSVAELRDVVRAVGASGRAIGMDVVELLPEADPRGMTSHAALLAILEFLDAWWSNLPDRPRAPGGAP